MNKCYALYYLKDEGSCWSDVKVVSNSVDKLKALMFGVKSIYTGSFDITNGKDIVAYSSEKSFPRYMIKEIPYVC